MAPPKYAIIGTSHCIICVFDYKEREMKTLETSDNYGAVTTMDINFKNTALIAGYEGGQIVLWDIESGMQIKKLTDFYTTSVLQIKFYKRNSYDTIASDNKGNVYLLQFS